MSDSPNSGSSSAADIVERNKRSLKTLMRAIALSGERRFSLTLVRCNYEALQQFMLQQLIKDCPVKIQRLELPQSARTLYTAIKTAYSDQQLAALSITGLDGVADLESLLIATNQVRDEFRKNFNFPLVLWVTDEVLKKLVRLAPDFHSWAATPISFLATPQQLLQFLHRGIDPLFDAILRAETSSFVDNSTVDLEFGVHRRKELQLAKRDLQEQGYVLEPELEASLRFALGRDHYVNDQIDAALTNYEQSLAFWQQGGNLERQALLLFHMGLCQLRLAELNRTKNEDYWQTARHYFQQCIDAFDQARRPDLVAQFIGQLGEVLERLKQWDDLKALAERARGLHTAYGNPARLARDYGFLAEVLLERADWEGANLLAQRALEVLKSAPAHLRQRRGLYLLLLARSLQKLNQPKAAIECLEEATESDPDYDPQLYIHILELLRHFYREQKQYLEAFRIKQKQRSIENQYGFRAFIGAGRLQPQRQARSAGTAPQKGEAQYAVAQEIAVSGRQRDVDRLVARVGRDDCKLTVIHGQSGVGKSSMVYAGLVPTLKQTFIGTRDVLPVPVGVYIDWVRALGRLLAQAFAKVREGLLNPLETIPAILQQLRDNEEHNLLTVLIFDQFEEFFFTYPHNQQVRQEFFEFLNQCLNIPYVKVILSLREDHLHHLLEGERLVKANNIQTDLLDDILNKSNRYELGNFSREDAKCIIEGLSNRSQFYLDPELVDELVRDLAGATGLVRPIELQVVGAELQTEDITTLARYKAQGPKERLVQRYLEEVVEDCGPENRRAAELVLYLLTDENNNRPLKTRAELERDAKAIATDLVAEAGKLDLVLRIFVDSGLVFLLPEIPSERYQLVHDYLVVFIRRQQEPKLNELIAELERERERSEKAELERKQAELQREQAEGSNKILEEANKQAKQMIRFGSAVLLIALVTAAIVAKQADSKLKGAELDQEGTIALRQFQFGQLDALLAAVKVGYHLKTSVNRDTSIQDYPASSPILALQQILERIQERNRIAVQGGVLSVRFSPDGKTFATASTDRTARLWNMQGQLLNEFNGHQSGVNGVSFRPDGQILATVSDDGTVRLWNLTNGQVLVLRVSREKVLSVSFSPDGKTLATGSADRTARLWDLSGNELTQFRGHQDAVLSVSFSPDGKTLVTGSADRTARLWNLNGNQQAVLTGHRDWVTSVSFSPNGQALATGSADRTARLWNLNGNQLDELRGHTDRVRSVSFSPDGKRLATASADGSVRIWRIQGNFRASRFSEEFRGHVGTVRDVDFSADGKQLVTVSEDSSIRLWKLRDNQAIVLKQKDQQLVRSISFSPGDRYLAAASSDGTIHIWNPKERQSTNFKAHNGPVLKVSFSSDGQYLASTSADGSASLWKLQGDSLVKRIKEFTGPGPAIWSVAFSPGGEKLATASGDGIARLWDMQGNELNELAGHQAPILGISFSPHSQMLATASADGTARLWNLSSNSTSVCRGHSGAVLSVSFNPEHEMIATASADGSVRLWDLQCNPIRTFRGHAYWVTDVSFSPDGQLLATSSTDLTARLWDLRGNQLAEFGGHQEPVRGVSFSHDGQWLATASDDRTVRLWPVKRLDDLLKQGCDYLKDYLTANPQDQEAIATCQSNPTSENPITRTFRNITQFFRITSR